ncbi:MAG: phosphodiester glycosidase family protein [Pseudomonadota bacterium]|nr:phosphodiester glycosidase family protein [Pseudomonadota bacterium]
MRALILVLLLAACARPAPPAAPVSPCEEQRFEQAGFIVCSFPRGRVEIRSGMRSFAALQARLGARADDVAFAMNGGMFDEAGAPIGLMVEDRREVHRINRREGGGNFHLLPNGVFLVREGGRAEVVASDAFKPSPTISFATQSGPMLVIDGKLHPKFEFDGTSRNVRNGVGIGPDGQPLFVITTDVVSFGKFARFFRDRLKAHNALYLDGSVSALWDPANGRMDNFVELGPLIVVFRPEASAPRRAGRATP